MVPHCYFSVDRLPRADPNRKLQAKGQRHDPNAKTMAACAGSAVEHVSISAFSAKLRASYGQQALPWALDWVRKQG
jgi:hypothetical protein